MIQKASFQTRIKKNNRKDVQIKWKTIINTVLPNTICVCVTPFNSKSVFVSFCVILHTVVCYGGIGGIDHKIKHKVGSVSCNPTQRWCKGSTFEGFS